MTFMIGDIAIEHPVFLAPMTGVTDLPFRRLVRKFGAGMVFSEMIASRCMIDEARGSMKAQNNYTDEFPMAVQLAGCDPDIMAEAARMNVDRGACVIDINFGCPVKKVVNKMAGSALMKDLPLAVAIVEATVKAVSVPVTVKMRLGWDDSSINAPQLAKMAEDMGAKMITVHGRTRSQMYNGNANWDAVRAVKDSIRIPVVVNGDIKTATDARTALEKSGADGVMVGRGSFGKPWALRHMIDGLSSGQQPAAPTTRQIGHTLIEHYEGILSFYGTHQGIGIGRKHIGWYCENLPDADTMRSDINRMTDPAAVTHTLRTYFEKIAP